MAHVKRPTALVVSPVVPALTGNGLSMRAGVSLGALAREYRLSLLVVPRFFTVWGDQAPEETRALCHEVAIRSEHAALTSSVAFEDAPFDLVHIFRRNTIPFGEPYLGDGAVTQAHLDLDDVESVSLQRIAARFHARGLRQDALQHEALAEEAARAERETLSRFDRVYVCAAADVATLPETVQSRAVVMPNVVSASLSLAPPAEESSDLLFVGTLGYFPNADGAAWFAEEVLPMIRHQSPHPCSFQIVGVGMSPLVATLRSLPGVVVVGYVPDVTPWYARSQVVVVPLFAGGGTRIKILEAFALGRPVVSTTMGAEGLAVEDECHLLLADDPVAFASACLRVMTDGRLRERLVENARSLVAARYSLEVLAAVVAPSK